jgi:UDP:flavonoid glycosyltransferase YjiC (YdhE family)
MRVLFAWEIGQNIGGATRLIDVARALNKKRGKSGALIMALQNPGALQSLTEGLNAEIIEAPYAKVHAVPGGPPLTYVDALRPNGYDNPEILARLVNAWRSLYERVQPDVIVAHAAPSALLAARGLPIKKVIIGTGFDVPPATKPLRPFYYWENIKPSVLAGSEAQNLHVINAALSAIGIEPLNALADMLDAEENILTVFEELDHYPGRDQKGETYNRYVGPFYNIDTGEAMSWNRSAKRRILAYLRPDSTAFRPCLEALMALPEDHDCIIAAPGMPPQLKSIAERPNIRLVDGAVRLDKLLKKCDLGINHAGVAIASAFLLSGVPQLLLPQSVEQFMFARALGRTGAARGVMGQFGPEKITEIMGVLQEPSFRQASQNYAKSYKSFKPDKLAMSIADKIVKLSG